MTVKRAHQILKAHNIIFNDFFDLIGIDCNRNNLLYCAIERVKTFITAGY